MADIEPMMLLGPESLPSNDQSAPAVGQGSEFEEPIDEAEVRPREDRKKPRQQPSDAPNEGKGGAKERHGREGGRKLGTGDGDSGSDSNSDEHGKEHRRSLADSWLAVRQWRQENSLAMEANREAGSDPTPETPAARRRRPGQELRRISNYPRRVLGAILRHEEQPSE